METKTSKSTKAKPKAKPNKSVPSENTASVKEKTEEIPVENTESPVPSQKAFKVIGELPTTFASFDKMIDENPRSSVEDICLGFCSYLSKTQDEDRDYSSFKVVFENYLNTQNFFMTEKDLIKFHAEKKFSQEVRSVRSVKSGGHDFAVTLEVGEGSSQVVHLVRCDTDNFETYVGRLPMGKLF
jgi:hypothetical protein